MDSSSFTIATVSTLPPLCCGIATYASDLVSALSRSRHMTFALHYGAGEWEHCDGNADSGDARSLRALAKEINASGCDVVNMQHEFGIWGGINGENIIQFLDALQKPLVTTLHTTFDESLVNPVRDRLLALVAHRSQSLIALSADSRKYICGRLDVPPEKLFPIPHGIPAVNYVCPPDFVGQTIKLCSIGYLRPDKGLEMTLKAIYELTGRGMKFEYVIAGSPQPQFSEQEQYTKAIAQLIYQLGLETTVDLRRKFISLEEQIELVQASHACVFAYQTPFHSSSGAIPLALACGRPVVCTPISYARRKKEEFSDSVFLCDGFDASAVANALISLASDRESIPQRARSAWEASCDSTWPRVAEQYGEAFAYSTSSMAASRK